MANSIMCMLSGSYAIQLHVLQCGAMFKFFHLCNACNAQSHAHCQLCQLNRLKHRYNSSPHTKSYIPITVVGEGSVGGVELCTAERKYNMVIVAITDYSNHTAYQ